MAQNHDLELALTAAAGERTNETADQPAQQTGQQTRSLNRPGHHHQHRRPGRIEFLYLYGGGHGA
jgi:hypothetical protein